MELITAEDHHLIKEWIEAGFPDDFKPDVWPKIQKKLSIERALEAEKKIRQLESKVRDGYQPDIAHLTKLFIRGGIGESIVGAVQGWHISIGKALELLRQLIIGQEENVRLPFDSDMPPVFHSHEWFVRIVDEIPAEWNEAGASYNISNVQSGDKIVLLRRIKNVED